MFYLMFSNMNCVKKLIFKTNSISKGVFDKYIFQRYLIKNEM